MTERLRLGPNLVEQMVRWSLDGRPNEACGLLASEDGRVVHVFAMTNASASPVRYSLDPREQLEVYREIERRGWELAGVFHSHTHTEAYPSPTDVRMASEDVPYLILSLAENPPPLRAFQIAKEDWLDEEGEITEIPVEVEGAQGRV